MKPWQVLFFILLTPIVSFSGYRVFELSIKNEETGQERKVTSTLDHIQYNEYYPVDANEYIEYVDSWMCWGNYSYHKQACPRPTSRQPALQKTKTPTEKP